VQVVRPAVTFLVVFVMFTGMSVRVQAFDHYYAGAFLDVCGFLDCADDVLQGTSGTISIDPQTVSSGETVAYWIGLGFSADVFVQNQWVQAGYAMGQLPDGTFSTRPLLYVEYQFDKYFYKTIGSVGFGEAHAFDVHIGGNSQGYYASLNVDGVEQATYNLGVLFPPYGHSSAFLEAFQTTSQVSGSFSDLKFLYGSTWHNWGDTFLTYWTQTRQMVYCTYYPTFSSQNNFKVKTGQTTCGGGGSPPGRRSYLDVAPPSGNTTIFWWTYILVGSLGSMPFIYYAWSKYRPKGHRTSRRRIN